MQKILKPRILIDETGIPNVLLNFTVRIRNYANSMGIKGEIKGRLISCGS